MSNNSIFIPEYYRESVSPIQKKYILSKIFTHKIYPIYNQSVIPDFGHNY